MTPDQFSANTLCKIQSIPPHLGAGGAEGGVTWTTGYGSPHT